ncbi:mitochondrial triosephosphate isomerase [Daldinia loculata]|uniref:mitochondrial triosephosphate isomerase n=1 Tax=Daldinia loculata TaxID=103429 RepID=UPI0020C2B617|nr:mitochondrial triosephosphate isomerase [Daldinia loculata]KAI1642759.1 mitochondrial triosephosphate isomerase [Daldinia loculata]
MISPTPTPTLPPSRRIVGVSTKMYFSAARTKQYVDELLQILSSPPNSPATNQNLLNNIDIFIIPDHITLTSVITQLQHSRPPIPILPGAQDAFHEDAGAYTGEISPAVLAEVGCRIVELGHAERRRIFGETDADTARKAAAAARNGLIPLICIGERSKADGEAGVRVAVDECRTQVEAVLVALPTTAEVVLAYEPVWAIGAVEPAGAEHVVAVTQAIRGLECVRSREGSTRILYGGSAGPGLFAQLKDGVDGLFLGRFAHDPAQFYKTIVEVATA